MIACGGGTSFRGTYPWAPARGFLEDPVLTLPAGPMLVALSRLVSNLLGIHEVVRPNGWPYGNRGLPAIACTLPKKYYTSVHFSADSPAELDACDTRSNLSHGPKKISGQLAGRIAKE
jgi:hypothetical protein